MRNRDKQDLRNIVKSIPSNEVRFKSISKLHKKYAEDFCYGTFRKYLICFRGKELKQNE